MNNASARAHSVSPVYTVALAQILRPSTRSCRASNRNGAYSGVGEM